MGVDRWHRYSKAITRTKRWAALRLQAKRRDGFQCVECGGRHHLEVDHVKPVRSNPELAFDLRNLQTLCATCHTRKTRLECGHPPLTPERLAWRDLLKGNPDVGISEATEAAI
jgi:5-methylcytosine-specific restriction protein A